jgi:hypothetical protein
MSTAPRAFSGPRYSQNADKAGSLIPCVVCGKAISTEHPAMVRVDTSNRIHAIEADLGDADMGCFPIGSECLRKHSAIRALASHPVVRADS